MSQPTGKSAARGIAAGLAALLTLAGCMSETRPPRGRTMPGLSEAHTDLSLDSPWTGWDDTREPISPLIFARDWIVLDEQRVEIPWSVTQRPTPKEVNAASIPLSAETGPRRVTILPRTPVPIPDAFDTVELWAEWEPLPAPGPESGEPLRIVLWIEDAGKTVLRVPWTMAAAPGWQLLHHALAATFASPSRFPARLLSIEAEVAAGRRGTLHLTGGTVYLRTRSALDNRAPDFRKNPVSRDPQDDDRVLFPFYSRKVETARLRLPLHREGILRPDSAGTLLRMTSGAGTNRTELVLDAAQPMSGVRIRFANGQTLHWTGPAMMGPGETYPGHCIRRQRTPGGFLLEYAEGLVLSLEAEGSGLALEYSDSNRQIREVQWPRLPARSLPLPVEEGFLSMVQAPGFETGSRKLCVGLAWDPFVSRASGGPEPLAKAQAFRVRYLPSEDGRIPVLRERFLLSIAPDLRDHLPGSDTFRPAWLPPEEVLLVTGDSRSAADAIARLGLSGVRILETFPPDRSRLSFDLHPLSPDWTRDAVLRRGEGNWAPGTAPATYRMKPATRFRAWLDAVEAQAPSASGAARLLLLPEQPLADWTDFDIRLASAGSFRGAMDLCVAAWQPEEDGGPIPALLLEEDTGAPFGPWAGALLLSDRQGLALAGKPGSRCPPGRFLKPERIGVGGFGAWRDAFPDLQEEAVLHRFLAVQLAHGVAGRIPEPDRIRPASLAHACHVLQSLRGQIAGQTADSVAQECDGRLLDGTTARLEGATGDRVYLHYAHGLELWVNQSGDRDWEVTVGPDRWRIPPDGWVAAGPDYLNISVLVDGARIDYIQSGSFDFFRSSDGKAVFRGYSAEGPVLIRRTGDTGVEVTDYAQSGRVRIPGNERAGFLARPWDGLSETGESTGRAKAEMEGDSLVLSGPAGTRRYIRHPETGPSEESQK